MTKRFLVFLIGFVFLGLIVFAQTPEENFQKAGQAELAKKETVILQQKTEIEKFFNEMANNTVISGLEMKTLKQMVGEFDKTREQYNKELEFYNLKTAIEIPDVIRKHLEIYFEFEKKEGDSSLYYGDNQKQEIRRYFIERTGQDIKVEKGNNLGMQAGLAFFAAIMLGFFFSFVTFFVVDSLRTIALVGIVAFMVIFFLIYVLF